MTPQNTPKSSAQGSVWSSLLQEALDVCANEKILKPLIDGTVTRSKSLGEAIARLLSQRLALPQVPEEALLPIFETFIAATPELDDIISRDLECVLKNDPAACNLLSPVLFFKGFHALQAYRLAHYLWNNDRRQLAKFIQSRVSEIFGVDIHPAAKIGRGVMLDHATGIVIGETAVVEDDVLFWHGVTLGGRALTATDRHPKVRKGAMLGAGSTILGNIEIGSGAKIAANSTVVESVPADATAAGVPAKIISS